MTVIPVKKYLFIGLQKDLDLFFKRAQERGVLEFIPPKGKRHVEHPEKVTRLIEALKILKRRPQNQEDKKRELMFTKDLDSDALASLVLERGTSLERLEEKKRGLKEELARIEPLGKFDLKEIQALEKETGRRIQFFYIKNGKKIKQSDSLIPVGSGHGLDYFMTISKEPKTFSHIVELRLTRSLEELYFELKQVDETIQKDRQELEAVASCIDALKKSLISALNKSHLIDAKEGTTSHLGRSLFSIEAWIPQNRLHALFPLLEGIGIHAEEIAIEKGEWVPTYLENQNYGKLGEDLVKIYDIPATRDKDPSSWVFWAFAIFFAMIISDAGYGAIFLTLALILRRKNRRSPPSGKRFLKLFTVLSAFCIGWGILSGSYFGLQVAPESPLNRLNFIQALAVKKGEYHLKGRDQTYEYIVKQFPNLSKETTGKGFLFQAKVEKNGGVRYVVFDDFRDSLLMEIALITGVIHIILSLLRQLPRHCAGLGWVIAILGAYLYVPKILNTTSIAHFAFLIPREASYQWGQQLFWGGIGFALLTSLIQNKWKGLAECIKIIELFADVLSYLRLYALGLAAMILAGTFNELGMKFGFVLGSFIILIGHVVNIAVGVMGGTIHGLRLNFIEWYHHSFEGGGKLFNPLKLIKYRGESGS